MSNLFCTWTYRPNLSGSLRNEFGDLDYFITELLSKARDRLLLVAPYLSISGMNRLKGPITTAVQNGAWIRLVTGDLQDESSRNFKSIKALISGSDGEIIRRRLRVLCAATELGFIHAKLIISDRKKGYLGSANLSSGGFDKNFEVGVALTPEQSSTFDRLMDALEADGLLLDITSSFSK